MKKQLGILALNFLVATSAVANINLPVKEQNYLNCLNDKLFKTDASVKFVMEQDVLKSKAFKNDFKDITPKNLNDDESGDAPSRSIYLPRSNLTLLGLPISKVTVTSADWLGGIMQVDLETPKTFNQVLPILESKYGKFSKFNLPGFDDKKFGRIKTFEVKQDSGPSTEVVNYIALEKKAKGTGSSITCSIYGTI